MASDFPFSFTGTSHSPIDFTFFQSKHIFNVVQKEEDPKLSSSIDYFFDFWCLTPLSAISWRPVLVLEETRVPEENHRPWASNW